ncbi:hypothetical protein AK812_SmicGene17369 [Symbiodinium microadriaticum]|uniref:Uncharacterized protein n=1 Tax=Symbiodinium microadriaticum TaxID=2951 RepID=A0A1Q9DXZ8_SYMMI|nr:hypothetical protein AK812_SmicGene17369 [Symbiodinium microadriaticum]
MSAKTESGACCLVDLQHDVFDASLIQNRLTYSGRLLSDNSQQLSEFNELLSRARSWDPEELQARSFVSRSVQSAYAPRRGTFAGAGGTSVRLAHLDRVLCILILEAGQVLDGTVTLLSWDAELDIDSVLRSAQGSSLQRVMVREQMVRYQTQDSFNFPSAEVFDEFADDFVINNGVIPGVKAQSWPELEKKYPGPYITPSQLPAESPHCAATAVRSRKSDGPRDALAEYLTMASVAEAEEADKAALQEVFGLCYVGETLDDALSSDAATLMRLVQEDVDLGFARWRAGRGHALCLLANALYQVRDCLDAGVWQRIVSRWEEELDALAKPLGESSASAFPQLNMSQGSSYLRRSLLLLMAMPFPVDEERYVRSLVDSDCFHAGPFFTDHLLSRLGVQKVAVPTVIAEFTVNIDNL